MIFQNGSIPPCGLIKAYQKVREEESNKMLEKRYHLRASLVENGLNIFLTQQPLKEMALLNCNNDYGIQLRKF